MTYNVADLPANMQRKITVDGDHWLWTGALNSRGYGCVGVLGKSQLTHRVAWELLVGPIPDGLVIDHVVARGCGIRACCQPAHLEPVTNLENIRRGILATKAECPQGHPYSGDNLVVRIRRTGTVNRECRACIAAARKRRAQPAPLAADDSRHGTTSAYTYYRCRCEPCKAANTAHLRIWREAQIAA